MDSLLALRKRKLVQWILAYGAGAWGLLQAVDLLTATYGWPPLIMRALPILLLVGLLAVAVLAWYHGEKGAQRVSRAEIVMLCAIILLAGVALAWVHLKRPEGGSALAAESARPVSAAQGGAESPYLAANVAARSVAVLPFQNLSRNPDNEYFSEGMTDEIVNALANVSGLLVISRTSVMQYLHSVKPARQIATELGVRHLLEGSVERSGDRVRVRVELIDAGTDAPIWAEHFDRPLDDLFAVQSEIAEKVVEGLQVRLGPDEQARVERRPTANSLAHDYVLRAGYLEQTVEPRSYEAAVQLARDAIALDSSYADAYSVLGIALYLRFYTRGDAIWLDSAAVTARRAIRLDPSLAQAYVYLGYALQDQGDRAAARAAFETAMKLNPSLSAGLANLYTFDEGRLDEAARLWKRALQADPANAYYLWTAGRTYVYLGMAREAREVLRRARQSAPEFYWILPFEAQTFAIEGRVDEERRAMQRMLALSGADPEAFLWAGYMALALGDLNAARRDFEQGLPRPSKEWEKERASIALAWVLRRSGKGARADSLLRQASALMDRRRRGQRWRPEDYAESAAMHVVAGDREGAIRALDGAVRSGWRLLYGDPCAPILESLRGDARYDRLVAEVRADVAQQRARAEREGS